MLAAAFALGDSDIVQVREPFSSNVFTLDMPTCLNLKIFTTESRPIIREAKVGNRFEEIYCKVHQPHH